jgi:hypothetical protein
MVSMPTAGRPEEVFMQPRWVIVLLWVFAVAMAVTGIGFVVAPSALAEAVAGESPTVASAITDMRAVSGGIAVALGVFFALCAQRTDWVVPGLTLGALLGVCLAASRVIGFVVDGGVTSTQVGAAAIEVTMVVVALAALRQATSSVQR